MRKIPVTEAEEHEHDLETAWIHENAFKAETLSKQVINKSHNDD